MDFTVNGQITRASGPGCNHYLVPLTDGEVSKTLHTSLAEIQAAAPSTIEEAREAIIARLRSAILEYLAANELPLTFANVRAALEGKTFRV